MKLHSIGWMFAMFESHDLFFGRDSSDFEFGRDRVIDHEGVITHGFEWRRHALENTLPIVSHFGCLAVHQALGAVHFAAEHRAEGLVPEADAEHGDLAGEMLDGIRGDTIILDGFAWTRRYHQVRWVERDQLVHRDLV